MSSAFALKVRREFHFDCARRVCLLGIGEMLASAGDDGNVLLWVPSEVPSSVIGEDASDDKETWRVKHMCRSSTGAEIYDLAWSPDGLYFITGGVDNTARIYNASTGERTLCYCCRAETNVFRGIDTADCRA